MHLLILGGSAKHTGGVEAFAERATAALLRRDPNWRIHQIATETAYLTMKRMPVVLRQLWELFRYRKEKPNMPGAIRQPARPSLSRGREASWNAGYGDATPRFQLAVAKELSPSPSESDSAGTG